MIDIKLKDVDDGSGSQDIDSNGRDQILISGVDCLKQRIRIKLGHISGEWYLKTNDGALGYDILGAKMRDIGIAKRIVREAIEEDPEIITVTEISATIDNKTRKIGMTYEARTIYGDIIEAVKL